jgi:hypothetical protein
VRHVEKRGDLLGPPARHDRDRSIPPRDRSERLARPLDRPRELGPRDDLGQRSVEVEQDARRVRAIAQRVELRR